MLNNARQKKLSASQQPSRIGTRSQEKQFLDGFNFYLSPAGLIAFVKSAFVKIENRDEVYDRSLILWGSKSFDELTPLERCLSECYIY